MSLLQQMSVRMHSTNVLQSINDLCTNFIVNNERECEGEEQTFTAAGEPQ